jgi:hypothetical protein
MKPARPLRVFEGDQNSLDGFLVGKCLFLALRRSMLELASGSKMSAKRLYAGSPDRRVDPGKPRQGARDRPSGSWACIGRTSLRAVSRGEKAAGGISQPGCTSIRRNCICSGHDLDCVVGHAADVACFHTQHHARGRGAGRYYRLHHQPQVILKLSRWVRCPKRGVNLLAGCHFRGRTASAQ